MPNLIEIEEYPLLQGPVFVNWNYTYRCQLNCSHCYSRMHSANHELSWDQKLLVVQNIIRNQAFFVNLGGGECLLDPRCNEIIRMLNDAGVHTSISTSGWRISRETLAALAQAGVGRVVVSIDSAHAGPHDRQRNMPGCFQAALECLENCDSLGIPTILSTVITRNNLAELEQIFDLACQRHCTGIDLKRLKMVGNAERLTELQLNAEEEAHLYRSIPVWKESYAPFSIDLVYGFHRIPGIDSGCPCGKRLLTIMDNGDMSACSYQPIIIGNAVRDDIGHTWRNSALLQKQRAEDTCAGLISEGRGESVL